MWKKIQWCGKMFKNYPSLEKNNYQSFFKWRRMNENEPSKAACSKTFNGDLMVKMHFVGFFFYVNDNKNIDCNNLKWCVVSFVMTIMSMHLIPKLKQENA